MKTLLLFIGTILLEFHQYHVFAQCASNDWSTYLGGTKYEYAEEIATDVQGNSVITGKTQSASLVATPGAYQTKLSGGSDAFVAKYDQAGNLLWSTYFGGPKLDYAYAIAVDLNCNIFIGGRAESSTGMTTPGSLQAVYGGGPNDGFVAKFSPDGDLLWCTYYGGKSGEWILGLATDPTGNIYITGYTGSTTGIATEGAQQTVHGGEMDCFILKLDADGRRQFCTYFGGEGEDRPHDIQVDQEGNIFHFATTPSDSGMTTPDAFQVKNGGRLDLSVSKWTSTGQLLWATFVGGKGDDRARECFPDDEGNIYLTGFTNSEKSIATDGAYQTTIHPDPNGKLLFDAFIIKFDGDGHRLWGTYYGGTKKEYGRGLRITDRNTILISGVACSKDYMSTAGAFQTKRKGQSDAYLAEFSATGQLIAATYFGGSESEPYEIGYGPSIDLDAEGNVYMALTTNSSDIPNAMDTFHIGETDKMYDVVLTRFPDEVARIVTSSLLPGEIMDMTLYPNPVTSVATLSVYSACDLQVTIRVTDLTGRVVCSLPVDVHKGMNESTLNFEQIKSGTYLVSIPELWNEGSRKIVVSH